MGDGVMSTMSIKAICFDMDGVIVDTMPHHVEAWQHAFSQEGHTLHGQLFYEREGMPGMRTIDDIDTLRSLALTKSQMDRIYHEKRNYFKENARYEFISASVEAASFLQLSGIPIALATGSRREFVEEIVSQLSFSFDAIITGDDVIEGKPSPEPYLKIAEKFNYDPEEWLVVENAPLGILSAKRAGMKVWAVETTLASEYLGKADKILKTDELMGAIQRVIKEERG
jgi:beta-phosphoglucomutase